MQRALGARVCDVRAAGQHRDRRAARLQRPLVRRAVDAQRHATDDRDAGGGEPAAQSARDLEPVGRRPARAHDGDGRTSRQRAGPRHDRRPGAVVAQRARIVGLVPAHGGKPCGGVGGALGLEVQALIRLQRASDLRRRDGRQQQLVGERKHLGQPLALMAR